MPDFETLDFSVSDGVAEITLNKPDAANAMDLQMGKDLMDVSLICDADPEIRAVLITAAGKMFCVGGDLSSFAAAGDGISQLIMTLTTYLHAAISRFTRGDAPVIIAVNGVAAGAGLSLAVTGDLVLASDKAKFTMAYTGAGLSPDGSSSYFLPRLIGMRKTQELMLTNRMLSAEEAEQWGLINRVVADDELLDEARGLAKKMASGPTKAYGVVKSLLTSSFGEGLESQMELEAKGIAAMSRTEDGKEGIAAFHVKRKPVFQGR
jgi:2-(1,2-epoxy-1,2-dihydrophenyl)acetyl-CoA isomerase